jgi:bacillithiol biosynthesis deacetylase BshB1
LETSVKLEVRDMRVLAIGAHPDDIELLCGGTMAKYTKNGHKVTIVTMTNGDKGHLIIPPEELGRMRLEEGRRGASILGADHMWVGYKDAEVFHDREAVMRVVEVIRKVKPDVLFTMSPLDYHPDHTNTGTVTVEAVFNAGVPRIQTESPAHVPKKVYFCETVFGIGFEPDLWVDISDFIEVKIRSLQEHKSQVEWLREHHGIDVVEDARTCARFRGLQVGVRYAEVFQQVKKHMQMAPADLP